MNALIKRDRAILEYLVYHYGKERVKQEINNIKKDIEKRNQKEINNGECEKFSPIND